MAPGSRTARWLAMGVFLLALALNFLDRQLLAAIAPALKAEFHLSNAGYGELISAFYFAYAAGVPLMGLLADRVGLRISALIADIVWSLAGASTALGHGLGSLAASRAGLGFGESAGIPLVGKALGTYLDPAEMGISAGFGAIGISLGSIAAPLFAATLVPRFGWRFVFVFAGALGLLWAPSWWYVSRRAAPRLEALTAPDIRVTELLADRRLWALTLAYGMVYSMYMLWANWTTVYLVQDRHLSLTAANAGYAWLPPLFAIVGGFLGGGLAFRPIRAGAAPHAARVRACWLVSPLLLAGVFIPFLPGARWAALTIGAGFLAYQCMLGCLTIITVDLHGARRAGFSNSVLGCAAALMQVLLAPATGAVLDRVGFTPLCIAAPVVPLVGLILLQLSFRRRPAATAPPAGLSAEPDR